MNLFASDDCRPVQVDLAIANRVLVRQGVLDAFGHVSVRDDSDPQRYLLSRSLAPALVTPADVMTFDLRSNEVSGGKKTAYLERFIHGAVYAARPDVFAIVHSHAPSVVPFSVARNAKLRAVCHMGGFLTSLTPTFEIRDHAGDATDLLIRDPELGDRLAEVLQDASVVLMRGHGMTVVGASLAQAVFRAVYTVKNAAIQAAAMALGEVTYLNDTEARKADLANQGQVKRAWDLWSSEVQTASA